MKQARLLSVSNLFSSLPFIPWCPVSAAVPFDSGWMVQTGFSFSLVFLAVSEQFMNELFGY